MMIRSGDRFRWPDNSPYYSGHPYYTNVCHTQHNNEQSSRIDPDNSHTEDVDTYHSQNVSPIDE